MDRPRFLRLLRIAFSAVCGIVCVLLIVFWVRSYSKVENLYVHAWGSNLLVFNSGLGQFAVELLPPRPQNPNWRFIRSGFKTVQTNRTLARAG
jgi:hypothetical protein